MSIFSFIKKLFVKKEVSAPTPSAIKETTPEPPIWLPLKGFEDKYQINFDGEIKNILTGKTTRGTLNSRGYLVVHLSYGGKEYMRSVHRLVAETLCDDIPEGSVIIHINGNNTDNRIENLAIIDRKNMKRNAPTVVHHYRQSIIQKDLDGNVIAKYKNANQAGKATNTSSSNIIAVCKNAYGRKTANGFKWEFEETPQLPLE